MEEKGDMLREHESEHLWKSLWHERVNLHISDQAYQSAMK
jgi:hypothetical protein